MTHAAAAPSLPRSPEDTRRLLGSIPPEERCSEGCRGWVVAESDLYGTQIEACDDCCRYLRRDPASRVCDEDVAELPEAQSSLADAIAAASPCDGSDLEGDATATLPA